MSTNPLGSTTPTQIGLVVPDIEAAVRAWATILGVPEPTILITDTVDLAHTEYKGQATPAQAKLAFFPMGQITLELIQPLGEPSTWNDQLVQHGASLHHIAFEIKGMGARIAELDEHGLKLVHRGDYTGGRYAYLDGQEKFGAVIELLEND